MDLITPYWSSPGGHQPKFSRILYEIYLHPRSFGGVKRKLNLYLGRPGPLCLNSLARLHMTFLRERKHQGPGRTGSVDAFNMESKMDTPASQTNLSSDYITTGILCKRLRLTRSRVRRWIDRGYIQPTYEYHRWQEWMHWPPDQVERARRLKWLCDVHGLLPSHAVHRLDDVARLEERLNSKPQSSSSENADQTST